jgi:hypothetical protein
MLRSGEKDRINCLANIGVSPDYTQTKALGDEAINANELDPDDWLSYPLEIEILLTEVESLTEFSPQGDIISPTDIESKVYAIKYILVHADNCGWDEKQMMSYTDGFGVGRSTSYYLSTDALPVNVKMLDLFLLIS